MDLLKGQFFFEENVSLDDEQKKIISTIFSWIIGKFEPKKGFLLTGNFGNGKSSIMKASLALITELFSIKVKENGIPEPKYFTSKQLARYFQDYETNRINEAFSSRLIGIDDFGYEPKEVKVFGTIQKPFEDVIMERYDKKRIVLATTNLSASQIKSIYGEYILDRLTQMCFWIDIQKPSFRK